MKAIDVMELRVNGVITREPEGIIRIGCNGNYKVFKPTPEQQEAQLIEEMHQS